MNRANQLIGIVIYIFFLTALVGGRGYLLSYMAGGNYSFQAMVFDIIALGLLILLLRIFDYGVRTSVNRIIKPKNNFYRITRQALRITIIIFIGGSFTLSTLQLHPQRISCNKTPDSIGLDYIPANFSSDGLALSGWYIPSWKEKQPVIIVAHGLNANKQNFLYPVLLLHQSGFNVFIFDFRAHGDSEGLLISFGFEEANDVKAAYDWVAHRYPSQPIYALGYSMGGAAVIRAAAEYQIFEKIVLDSTFSSLENVAKATILKWMGPLRELFWYLGRFWIWVWTEIDVDRHRPIEYIPLLAEHSLMFIHGKEDKVIPYTESSDLYGAGKSHSEIWLIEGAGHVQGINRNEYRKNLSDFFGPTT